MLTLPGGVLDRYGAEGHKEIHTDVFSSVTAWDGRPVVAEKPYLGLQRSIQTLGGTRSRNYLATYAAFMLSTTFARSGDDFVPLDQDADKRYVRKTEKEEVGSGGKLALPCKALAPR